MPVRSGNLTIFPVTSDEWSATERFITLDEGLRSGGVTVSELGGYRRVRGRGQSGQSDNAEVNTLSLTNRSGKTLILLAGELLVGGKQDRIVDHDQLVPSDDTPIALGVFCVEHGRWQGANASFGHSQGATRPPGGARNFVGGGAGGGAGSGQMANPAVRHKAEVQKSQTEVWSQVEETTKEVNAKSASGALTRAYDDRKVSMRTAAYVRDLKERCSGKNVVGVVVAVNGELVASDIFASPSLFRRYWPKLLESYALEAISAGKGGSDGVDLIAAQTFLTRVQGDSSSQGKDGVYRLTEHKSGNESSFELEDVALHPPLLVHFNRIAAR